MTTAYVPSSHFLSEFVRNRTDALRNLGLEFAGMARAISMRKDKEQSSHKHDWLTRAAKALEKARRMKPGLERNDALKKAGQLQSAADMMGYLTSKELQPPK
jgi:hypothetical protein